MQRTSETEPVAIDVGRVLITLVLAGFTYGICGFAVAGLLLYVWSQPRFLGVDIEMFALPVYIATSFGVGFFVGRRLPRYGYAYATIPVVLVTVLVRCLAHRQGLSWPWAVEFVLAVLLAAVGGWTGGRSMQRYGLTRVSPEAQSGNADGGAV